MSGDEAEARHLSGHLRDANRATELICRFAADDDAADIAERPVDHGPGFLNAIQTA